MFKVSKSKLVFKDIEGITRSICIKQMLKFANTGSKTGEQVEVR